MRKNVRWLMVAVIIVSAIIIIGHDTFKEDALLAASQVIADTDGFLKTKGIVKAVAYYGNEYMEEEDKILFLEDVALALGITEGLVFSSFGEAGKETVSLSKKGACSDTVLSVVALEGTEVFEKQSVVYYVICEIGIENSPESVCYYEEVLGEYLSEKGLAGDVTTTLIGYFDGDFDVEESSGLTDAILKRLDADVVAENRTKELFSVYAYTKRGISEAAINLGGVKTNVNIAVNYNENLGQTRVYLATPIIGMEY